MHPKQILRPLLWSTSCVQNSAHTLQCLHVFCTAFIVDLKQLGPWEVKSMQ